MRLQSSVAKYVKLHNSSRRLGRRHFTRRTLSKPNADLQEPGIVAQGLKTPCAENGGCWSNRRHGETENRRNGGNGETGSHAPSAERRATGNGGSWQQAAGSWQEAGGKR
jgi:hypothetical protein